MHYGDIYGAPPGPPDAPPERPGSMSKGRPRIRGLLESGLRHHRAGHLLEAKTLYEQVLALAPQNPDASHLLGVATLQTGDADESIRLIRAAIAVQPKHRAFHSNLAKALMEARRPEEALPAFQSAERLDPGNPEHQMGVANCLALTGCLAEADSRLRRITQRFPDFALAWFNLANAVRDQGRTAEALDCFRRALKLDDNLIEAHVNLGGVLLALGRLDEAEQAYRRALALRPDDPVLQCNLASVLIDFGKFVEAEAVCRKALAREPRFATAHRFLGAAIGPQGRLREALESHRRVVELEPDNARALAALGAGLHEVGMSSEGVPMLERALSLAPDSGEFHFQLAVVKLALGEFQEGWREHLHRPVREQFIRLNPGVALSSTLPRDLAERHVCVLHQQGLGDQLFFLRFAGHLKACGARVTYRAAPEIAGILKRVPTIDLVIPATEPIPPGGPQPARGRPAVSDDGSVSPRCARADAPARAARRAWQQLIAKTPAKISPFFGFVATLRLCVAMGR